jgi:acyl-CoA thioester hydrolase
MKNSYTITLIVSNKHIDDLGHVNNLVYLEWVLNIAGKHWEKISTDEMNIDFVWVVLRHEIDYISSAKLNDEIIITTWIGNSYGVKSERFVEIKIHDKVIAKAKTTWCLVAKKTMRAVRIPSNILAILK